MLVLSRKKGQDLRIGNGIRISVMRVSGSRVVLGIDAPESVRVLRGELSFDSDDPLELDDDAESSSGGSEQSAA